MYIYPHMSNMNVLFVIEAFFTGQQNPTVFLGHRFDVRKIRNSETSFLQKAVLEIRRSKTLQSVAHSMTVILRSLQES